VFANYLLSLTQLINFIQQLAQIKHIILLYYLKTYSTSKGKEKTHILRSHATVVPTADQRPTKARISD